jgi:5-methylcytosine-specific restriction endonuclease McrA
MKICPKCGSAFDGERCKPCRAAWAKAYRAANSKKLNAEGAARYLANKENIKAHKKLYDSTHRTQKRIYREKNKERERKNNASRREANKEKIKIKKADYYSKNRDDYRLRWQSRRTLKSNGVLSKGLTKKLFELQRGRCACCGKPLGDDYHLDHIMPLALGGANEDKNMQLLRQRCNNQKHAKDPIAFMQERGFLL